ncbi:hypothetical protein L3X38_034383 [Prunus dulcis]|uniref:Transposable element protein n=1 Tax=Prunus dulcis TaxID=3755 RepID=A0AAD4VJ54_PRUDU|nr:hypothetical protein L3X38_034383 [Prunus dulcis]
MFAWSPFDMPGIDPNIICHWLHVNPASKPVVQKRHNFASERVAIIEAEIDKLLAAIFIEELLSFMDVYSSYNQIMMYDNDKAKASFIIERANYCYKIGRTMEVYVDDMLVKALKCGHHLKNLAKPFNLLRQYRMKLNPSKYMFGVSSGRFLSEGNTNLTGRAAALNRFLSKSTDKCRSFFKTLKNEQKDKWDEECEVVFQSLKTYLTSPPLLLKPVPGEDLFVYLAVSNSAVSSALI